MPKRQRQVCPRPAGPLSNRGVITVPLDVTPRRGRIALALPHAGIAPLIAIAFPVIATALTVAFTAPRGQRRAVCAGVGFNPRRGGGLLIAVVAPAVIIAVSFGVAAATTDERGHEQIALLPCIGYKVAGGCRCPSGWWPACVGGFHGIGGKDFGFLGRCRYPVGQGSSPYRCPLPRPPPALPLPGRASRLASRSAAM
jgi:hypothetical protein